MHDHRDDDRNPIDGDEVDAGQGPRDTDETREPWTRPRLSRLATRSTVANPTFGADGGAAFLTLS